MRALPALALLFGYFVLGTALALGLTALTLYAVLAVDLYAALLIGLFAVAVTVPMVSAVARALFTRPKPAGIPLTRAAQPELWHVLDELARAFGTRAPDDVFLIDHANALIGERRGRRHLMIGLPLLGGMTVDELRAVLAHELGHYAVGRSRLEALAFRANLALQHSLHDRRGNYYLDAVYYGYTRLYALAAAPVCRAHERFADELSVTAVGPEIASRALRRAAPLHHAWGDYVDGYVRLALTAGRTPPLFDGFLSYLSHPRRVAELRDYEKAYADAEPASAADSHPPTRERVAAMEAATGPAVVRDERPAWTLTPGVANLAQALLDPLPLTDWAEIVRIEGPKFVAAQASVLAHAARTSRIGGTLRELFDALARGELRKLTGETVDLSVSPDEAHRAAVDTVTELLAFAVSDALVRAGRAELELNWGGIFTLRFPDGALVHPDDLVAPAVHDPAQVERVRAHLRAMGVNDL